MPACEVFGTTTPCSWRDGGTSITTNRGLFTSLSWSPSGGYIAVSTQTDGVWLLDLSNNAFSCIIAESLQWWHRPTWGDSDDVVFLGSSEGTHEMRRSNGVWRDIIHTFGKRNVLWQGRTDEYGCLGVQRYSRDVSVNEDKGSILHADRAMRSAHIIHPYLPDGHPLSMDLGECPVWWKRGVSALVVAWRHGAPSNYIVDLSTGTSVPKIVADGVLRRLSASSDPYLITGSLAESLLDPTSDSSENLICVSLDDQALDIATVPSAGPYQSMAISPDANRVAVIERDLTVTIFPVPSRAS